MSTSTHRGEQSPNILQSEPVITAAVSALIVKGIALAVEFGAPITEGQADTINGFSSALMVLIFIAVRFFVTPKAKVVEQTITVKDGADIVVAGEANEIPTGEVIRTIGADELYPDAEA